MAYPSNESAGTTRNGQLIISKLSANVWTIQGSVAASGNEYVTVLQGVKSISDVLTRLRITTVNGTDTFDAGTVNILYE